MSKTLAQITTALEADKTAIRQAILSGGGTCPEGNGFDDFAADIGTIPTGTPGAMADVNIYDYDGTIIASYTKQQFLALSDYPTHPDRTSEGLTSDGWTHTFEEAQAYVEECGMLEIGALYYVTSGKFEIRIHIPEEANTTALRTISLYCSAYNNGVRAYIKWGDGSTNLTDSTIKTFTHSYYRSGDFVITFELNSSSGYTNINFGGDRDAFYSTDTSIRKQTINYLKAIYFQKPDGDSLSLGNTKFTDVSAVVPILISTNGYNSISSDTNLPRHLNVPPNMTYVTLPTTNKICTIAAKKLTDISSFNKCKRLTFTEPVHSSETGNAFVKAYAVDKIICPKPASTTEIDFRYYAFTNIEELDLSDFNIRIYYNDTLANCINLKRIVFGHIISISSSRYIYFPKSVQEIKFIDTSPISDITRIIGDPYYYYLPPRILIPSGSLSNWVSATGLDASYFTEY